MGDPILPKTEKIVLDRFKALLSERVGLHSLTLFGSRARGDADPDSDLDVLVVLDSRPTDRGRDLISDCAWEAGFEYGLVVVPVVFEKREWEEGPERYSLLSQAVLAEGIPI
jgi:predicted nucleotidyltransferase